MLLVVVPDRLMLVFFYDCWKHYRSGYVRLLMHVRHLGELKRLARGGIERDGRRAITLINNLA